MPALRDPRIRSRSVEIAFLVFVAAVVALFMAAKIRYAGRAPVRLPAQDCDPGLWNHVYEKQRLRVVEPCTIVDGRVASVAPSWDGDLHIDLDPDQKSVLNPVNATHAGGKLVVEIICEHVPNRPDAKAACANFHSQITTPKVNDRLRVTGAYVTDVEHGWREVHPVTRIEILSSSSARTSSSGQGD